jgi:NADP-reducing hydrogenase subunit HndB
MMLQNEYVKHDGCAGDKNAQDEKVSVIVQFGICSQAVGAADVLAALKQSVRDEGLENVSISITGCMGSCSYEPIVIIKKDGREPVTYCRVAPRMARVILAEYVKRPQFSMN